MAFDASTSSDPDNAIVAYEWNFGDGGKATGPTATHPYAAAGTYEVTLKATDALGATASLTQEVAVLAPNTPPVAAFTAAADKLTLTVDGSTSSDADGAIATYSWAFGDGAVKTGATTSHTYAQSGTFTVSLTVTDDRGGSATTQQQVTVTLPPNQLPTAAFSAQISHLTAAFNAGGSTDPDGTIASYAWDFGDGTTGTGVMATRTYAAAGTHQVVLTVTDDRGGVATSTRTVTTSLAPNQLPTAAFTKSVSNLAVSVDGAASTDPDGTIASYAWAFGDGGTATGARATHTYNAPGAYSITLTVTDDRGGVATKTGGIDVSVSDVLAKDSFERTGANGWGTADQGGAWTTTGTAARFAVAGGAGTLTLANSTVLQASLGSVSSVNTRLAASFSVDKIANAQYISFVGRQAGANQYLLRLRVATDGSVIAHVMRGGTAIGAGVTVPGVTIVPGATYKVVFDVTGTSPTTLAAKVWKSTDTEPTAWQITRTDSTAGFQAAGSVAVSSLVPTSANAYPVKVSFGEISVTDPTVVSTPNNQLPTAAFTSSAADLAASFDGSASSDTDGSIASYAWNFGDGATATGAAASHPYAAAGTYTVTLTVTDNRGGQATVSHDVTVTAPANQVPVAGFTSSVSGLSVSVDGSSSSDADGSIGSYAWSFGDGGTASGVTASHPYAAAGTYTVTLTVTDNAGASSVKTGEVAVTAPPVVSNVLAKDAFERAGVNGWGTADQGGAWTTAGVAARFAVEGGAGVMTLTNSTTHQAMLAGVSSANTRLNASFSVDKIANAQYISFIGRQVGAEQYLLRVRIAADGSVILNVMRGGTSIGASYTVPGLTITPGATYNVSFEVTGTSPTTLAGKIWNGADAEPAAWQVSRTDATASLQGAGSVGVSSLVPTSAAAYPLRLTFPDITAINPTMP